MSDPWNDEFDPSRAARRYLRWALEMGGETLGDAYDLLDQFEVSNDVPEILDHDDRVEDVRDEIALGVDLVGSEARLTSLL